MQHSARSLRSFRTSRSPKIVTHFIANIAQSRVGLQCKRIKASRAPSPWCLSESQNFTPLRSILTARIRIVRSLGVVWTVACRADNGSRDECFARAGRSSTDCRDFQILREYFATCKRYGNAAFPRRIISHRPEVLETAPTG